MAKKANTKIGQYKDFLENVDLYALGLDSVKASLKRAEYTDRIAAKNSNVIHQIESSFAVADFDEDHFDVRAVFSVSVKSKEEMLLEVETIFSAHFHPKKGAVTRADADQFAKSEARLIFWPYFRQAVADITSRMHIRPLTIPLTFRK